MKAVVCSNNKPLSICIFIVVLSLLTTLTTAAPSPNPNEIQVNLQGFINQAVAEGKKYIKIPGGRYYVEPEQENSQTHLVLNNLVGVEIDATNVELVWYVSWQQHSIDTVCILT
jgi:aryl-phospho-beta-D-glucosidase BglC (GH1 family)